MKKFVLFVTLSFCLLTTVACSDKNEESSNNVETEVSTEISTTESSIDLNDDIDTMVKDVAVDDIIKAYSDYTGGDSDELSNTAW